MLDKQEQFFRQIADAKKIAVVFNKNWSGDALAAALALSQLLIKLGKTITLVADHDGRQKLFSFLPFFPFVQPVLDSAEQFIISLNSSQLKIKDLRYRLEQDRLDIIISPEPGSTISSQQISSQASGFSYDSAVIIGSGDLESLGLIYQNQPDFFYQTPIINLDCQATNEAYGQINIIDLKVASISEIIFNLFADKTDLIDPDIATCLLAGIIDNTANFKSASVSPQTLTVAADLIKLGGRRQEIIDHLYRGKKISTLKLWGSALSRLGLSANERLAWTWLSYEDIAKLKLKRQDLIILAEELIANLESLELIIIFVAKDQETLAMVYSLKNFDALELTKNYAPQGNKKLAQILFKQPLETVIKELTPDLSRQL